MTQSVISQDPIRIAIALVVPTSLVDDAYLYASTKFRLFSYFICAPHEHWRCIPGFDQEAILKLQLIKAVVQRILLNRLCLTSILVTRQPLNKFLSHLIGWNETESFVTMCFSQHGFLISFEIQSQGTVDQCDVNLHGILRSAVRVDAKTLVVCHNHPGGTLSPSEEDILFTEGIVRALRTVNIQLLDSLIVYRGCVVSVY